MDAKLRKKAGKILKGKVNGISSLWPFIGPAFIVSIGYVDPGNFIANIQAGAEFGYMLIWVLILASLFGVFFQTLSAKLGIATGKNLAELCRDHFPKPISYLLWVQAEIVLIATDLAAFIGAALGVHLLFHIPVGPAGLIIALITYLFLIFERKGFRPFELLFTFFVSVIVLAFALQVFFIPVDGRQVIDGLWPSFSGQGSIYITCAILGATLMPHIIYLHSALTQKRIVGKNLHEKKKLFHFQIADISIAMSFAIFINLSLIIIAASTFHKIGLFSIHDMELTYLTLKKLIGPYRDLLFGIALIVSGLSSTIVGTLAGQILMKSFVRFNIPIFIRRTFTMVPSLVVLFSAINPTKAMIFSQVILCFGIPFALIPLLYFTQNKNLMKNLQNHRITFVFAVIVSLLIIVLNFYLLIKMLS